MINSADNINHKPSKKSTNESNSIEDSDEEELFEIGTTNQKIYLILLLIY